MYRPVRRSVRRMRVESPVEDVETRRVPSEKEPSWKFGAIFVKFEDSDASFVYNGDTFEFIPRRKDYFGGIPDENLGFPKFVATQEMREKYYKMRHSSFDIAPIDIDSSDEQIPLKIPIANPELNFKKSPDEVVVHLLQAKKRYIMFIATSLRETIAQQSKKMNKLCSNVEFLESRVLSSSAGDDQPCSSNNQPLNSSAEVNVQSVTIHQSASKLEANACCSPDCDPCVYCSLQNNISKTLEEQQKCLTVSLRVCERMANILNDLCELISPNHSIGKRLRKALLTELRCEVLLSSKLLKMQNMYASNLNKMQKLLLTLSDSKTSTVSHVNGKESKDTKSAMNDLINPVPPEETSVPEDKGHRVVSDEKSVETNRTMSSSSSESLKKSSCYSSDNLQQGVSYLSRNLDVFLKCSKTLVSLELSIIHMLYDLLEEEETSVPKSLENIQRISDEMFTKDSVLLKHRRNPYRKEFHLAKTSDKLKASYRLKLNTILIPDGEGTLCTADGHVIYQGNWKKGKIHGYGRAFVTCTEKQTYWSSVGEYEGNWKSNARHGFGHMVFSDGSVYDGEWEMDEIQGRGVMRRFDGCTLEGHWSAGNPHGCLTFTWPHGSSEYREYKHGDILRVFDPRQDLSSSIKTIRGIENAMEEKTYYKNCVRSLREEMSSLKEHYEKKENQEVVEERAEKMEIVNALRIALDESQQVQKQEAEKLEELRMTLDCQICMNRPKDCLLLPCLHFNFCIDCVQLLKVNEPALKCPTCRQPTHGEIHCRFS